MVITTFGVKCTYTAGTGIDLGTLTGSTSGKAAIDLNTVVSKSAGDFLCPETVKWTATYTVTSPSLLSVEAS